jgi:hypothetical protein
MSSKDALAQGIDPHGIDDAAPRREPSARRSPFLQALVEPDPLSTLAVLVCVATPILVALDVTPGIRGPVILAFFLLVPGTALVGLTSARPADEPGLVLGVGLGALTVGSQVMLSARVWHPVLALYVVAETSLFALMVGRSRARSSPRIPDAASTDQATPPAPVTVSVLFPREHAGAETRVQRWMRTVDFAVFAQLLLLGDAIALWSASLAHIQVGAVSGIGLMSGMPGTYELALVSLAAGFGWAVCSPRPRAAVLALYTAGLILVLHGTTAVLYAEPRYTWVYKHLGVIQYLAIHGSANRAIDIYQNWPGFFALNAWFSRATGWTPIGYAGWAQVAFECLNVAALLFCLRGLTDDSRHVWIACWVFICANWLAQDYLAPQAFGFFETLIVLGLVLRCAPRSGVAITRVGTCWKSALERAQSRLHLGHPDTRSSPLTIGTGTALVFGALCFGSIVVSHQLTPFDAAALVLTLVVIGRARPVWLPFAMVAVAGAWLYLAWPFVARHFSLFSLGRTASAHPQGYRTYAALPGIHIVDAAKLGLVAALACFAAAGLWMSIREGRHLGIAAALAATPFVTAVVQSYGGEGWLRALLFALPWLAFLAARMCTRLLHESRTSWMPALGVALVSVVLLGPFLYAYFGQETINHVTTADVAANQWYVDHAPRNSVIGFVAANAPARLGARYADLQVGYGDAILTNLPAFRGRPFRAGDIDRVADTLAAQHGSATFLVTGPSQSNYLRYYGIVPPDWYPRLVTALRASPRFHLVFRRGPAMVFQLLPPVVAPTSTGAAR